jgi:hypothetical protein
MRAENLNPTMKVCNAKIKRIVGKQKTCDFRTENMQ